MTRLRFKTVVIPMSRAEALIEQTIIKVWPYIERVHENIRFRIRRRRLSHPIHDSRDKLVCLLDRNSMRTWLHCRHGSSSRICEPDEMRTDNAVPFDFRNALHRTEPPATPTRRSLKTIGETNGLNVTTAPANFTPASACRGVSRDQARRIHSASRTKARDDFAAWGRNHQKRSTKAKRIHSASRTRARDDFAAWGRNHQKRSTTHQKP